MSPEIVPSAPPAPAAPEESLAHLFIERLYRDLLTQVKRSRGKVEFTFRNVTAVFAITVAVLYSVGIIQRLGVLNRERVPIGKALPLTALQSYFVAGLADLLAPTTLVTIVGIAVAIPLILLSPYFLSVYKELRQPDAESVSATAPEPTKDRKLSESRWSLFSIAALSISLLFAIGGIVVAIDGLLFLPLAIWGPVLAAVSPAAVAWYLVRAKIIKVAPWEDWGRPHARIVAITVAAMLFVFVIVKSWYVPAPLDIVHIQTFDGAMKPAALLGTTDSFVYVLVARQGEHRSTIIRAVPIDRIAAMTVEGGKPRSYATIPQLLHVSTGPFKQRFEGSANVSVCKYLRIPQWLEEC
jgi:hypothetical protein